eukprot:12853938-Prorocentrum_lima.AAC.1
MQQCVHCSGCHMSTQRRRCRIMHTEWIKALRNHNADPKRAKERMLLLRQWLQFAWGYPTGS